MLPPRLILFFSIYLSIGSAIVHSTANALDPCEFPFCADGANCADVRCSGCLFNCVRTDDPRCITESETCKSDCEPGQRGKRCRGCILYNAQVNHLCPLGTFRDITESVFSGEDSSYWSGWFRAGKPSGFFSSPTMVDINGDSVLDFFTAMHGANLKNEKSSNARMQLGYTVMNTSDPQQPMHFRAASKRIIVDDEWQNEENGYGFTMDKHGEIVADLDNDGYLDIFIVSGGGRGGSKEGLKINSRDNLLLFGEKGEVEDEDSGSEVTIFRGGRTRAEAAGIEGRYGRGRFSYLLDMNQDGLLDIFIAQPRREDNNLAPGHLYINQGDRTWKKDSTMSEFTEVMLLTDADGDSIAEEVMMIRGYCFPRRDHPNQDSTFGPFPDDIKDYCSTKPIGSVAVYKLNSSTGNMEEISPKYSNISAETLMQPECCSHGTKESYEYGCSAVSIASADFDGDMRADQIVLYPRKMVFFFSSDRPVGELPIEKKYIGFTIDLPPMCTRGESIQLIDMNNSGKLDIVVVCSNIGTFLIYTQGEDKVSWDLHENCHENGSLGDMVFSSFEVTLDDIMDACARRDENVNFEDLCKDHEYGGLKPPKVNGVTFADINNDGFVDTIVGTKFGYQKFFIYQPSPQSKDNRHISFRIVGNGKDVNIYGIGATLILYTQSEDGEEYKQFREISSYQHIGDKGGHQDEKVIFGLGKELSPVKIVTKWPNGMEQISWLTDFDPDFSMAYPAIDINYPGVDGYYRIRNKKLTDSEDQLCLVSTIRGGESKKVVRLANCNDGDPSEREQFILDEGGMLKNRRFPEYCLADRNSRVYLFKCEDVVQRNISWQQTNDGFIRLSGSNMVLSGMGAEGPMLVEMDESQEGQRWIFEIFDKIEFCNEEDHHQFFIKMNKSIPFYRRCGWLKRQRARKLQNICENFTDSHDGRGPASEVCCNLCRKR